MANSNTFIFLSFIDPKIDGWVLDKVPHIYHDLKLEFVKETVPFDRKDMLSEYV